MKVYSKVTSFLIFAVIVSFSVAGYSAEPMKDSSTAMPMTPETKKDMAEMHLKMGNCLKTEKSMQECHEVVMKDCPMMKKTGHCPMMDGSMSMMGKGKKKGMDHSH